MLVIATAWAWRLAAKRSLSGVLFAATVALPLGMVSVGTLFVCVKMDLQWSWSGCRLAPALGMLKGFPLYSPADHGPINGWLYGPIPAFCWLPAGLCATPIAALRVAESLNALLLICPIFAACLLSAGAVFSQRVLAIWCAIGAASALICFYPTWYMTAVLTADATAAGLGMVGCVLLSGNQAGRGRLVLAAAATAAAIWSKQIAAPLAVVQVLWLALSGRRSLIPRYLCCLILFVAGMGFVFVALFGAANMYFNMWVIPTSQFLVGGWPLALERAGIFALTTLPVLAIWLWAWMEKRRRGAGEDGTGGVPILFLATVLMLPVGIAASMKIGGDQNSMHSYYFVIAGAAVTVASLAGKRPEVYASAALLLGAMGLVSAVYEAPRRPVIGNMPRWDKNEAAFDFARSRPGESYFPWDPLATLLAENRFYHFEYGVQDRIYAGREPGPRQLAEGLPAHLKKIIYPMPNMTGLMVKLVQPYIRESAPGPWTIYYYDGIPAPILDAIARIPPLTPPRP
jgi:hypothetical protein